MNGQKSYLHTVTSPNKLLRINRDGRILYSMRFGLDNNQQKLEVSHIGFEPLCEAFTNKTEHIQKKTMSFGFAD